jgi:RNA polymerase sigma-70 factor (ECF subfamily)
MNISFIRVQKKIKYIEDETYFVGKFPTISKSVFNRRYSVLIDSLPDGYKMVFNLMPLKALKHQYNLLE